MLIKSKAFSKGLLYHLKWKADLKQFIFGKINSNVAESSSDACMFGKWLCSNEITRYASAFEIRQINNLHAELHEVAARACELKILDQNAAARREFKKMQSISMNLNSLLLNLLILNKQKN